VKVGDLVVYVWKPGSGLPSIGEEYGLGIILDENPYYYFISWSNICSDSPMLATIKENVIPATIENVQQIRAVVETEKELDKWAII
jgi:hypothetical protein